MQEKSNLSKELNIHSKTIDFYDHTDGKLSNSKTVDYKGLAAVENYSNISMRPLKLSPDQDTITRKKSKDKGKLNQVAVSSGINSLMHSKINSSVNFQINSAGGPTGDHSKQ